GVEIPSSLAATSSAITIIQSQSLGPLSPISITLASGNISLAAGSNPPAALQWTIGYSPADVSTIGVIASSPAIEVGKTLACNPTPGSIVCILYGLTNATIPDGIIATLQLMLSPSIVSTVISLSNGIAADPGGVALTPVTTTGDTITANADTRLVPM